MIASRAIALTVMSQSDAQHRLPVAIFPGGELRLMRMPPLMRAYQRDPALVTEWIRHEFPRIRAKAKAVVADIFFGDEAAVLSDYHTGTTWAPVGVTPVVKTTGARFKLNLISAISPTS
ncbi:hypothetical protein GCM10007933_24070 [Zoogloea oryzae]|uniref:Uncharacterized protein n=1 Tax=Zoogloea oryzae TaxID=310767 RepID=A0ABQ6FDF2_9RHOO|nr:hypothetical protein [Zoogloea oryzae]GLT22946.1 hypothetical protein GCM10007933_24070 [Zoogloea oryzae]